MRAMVKVHAGFSLKFGAGQKRLDFKLNRVGMADLRKLGQRKRVARLIPASEGLPGTGGLGNIGRKVKV